jgi:hypothetical protein
MFLILRPFFLHSPFRAIGEWESAVAVRICTEWKLNATGTHWFFLLLSKRLSLCFHAQWKILKTRWQDAIRTRSSHTVSRWCWFLLYQIEPRGACADPLRHMCSAARQYVFNAQRLPFAGQTFQTCACQTKEHMHHNNENKIVRNSGSSM